MTEKESAELLRRRFGGYELLEEIGQDGAMGAVFSAIELSSGRSVALKMLKAELLSSSEMTGRFRIEIEAATHLEHSNVLPIYEVRENHGQWFYTMKLARGGSLASQMAAGQWAPCWGGGTTKVKDGQQRIARLLSAVANGVHHAHQRGVLHRDIKPSNILLDEDGNPYVSDFGLAKLVHAGNRLTRPTGTIGTPAYMSPEQALAGAHEVTARSDVWGLGVILYELLTGCLPFPGDHPLVILSRIRSKSPLPPRQIQPQIDPDLETIALKCLEKDPGHRYSSADEFGEELRRFLGNRPIIARPASQWEIAVKWARRNPVLAGVLAFAVITLAGGIVATSSQAYRASHAEGIANQRAEAELAQRKIAIAERDHARDALYYANMGLIQQAWDQGNIQRVRHLMDEVAAHTDHGFEWYYWKRQTHRELITLRGHTAPIPSVAVTSSGHRIATGSWDATARIWDATNGICLHTLSGHQDQVHKVCFSPDDRLLATASADFSVRLWDVLTGVQIRRLTLNAAGLNTVGFSPDGRRLLATGDGGAIQVWNIDNGSVVCSGTDPGGFVVSADYIRDGLQFLTVAQDRSIRIWDAETGALIEQFDTDGPRQIVLAMSPVGPEFTTVSWANQDPIVWHSFGGPEKLRLTGHANRVRSIAYSEDGTLLITGSSDHTARIWDARSGKSLTVLRGHHQPIRSVAFLPRSDRVVTGSSDGTAKVWNWKSPDGTIFPGVHSLETTAAKILPAEGVALTVSLDGSVKTRELISGKELRIWQDGPSGLVSVESLPGGKTILTGARDGSIQWRDALTGHEILRLTTGVEERTKVALSPDGSQMAAGDKGGIIHRWRAADGSPLFSLEGGTDRILALNYSADGRWLIAGSEDKIARVWDSSSGRCAQLLRGHNGRINFAAFSSIRDVAVTGSEDGTAIIWDAIHGKIIQRLVGHAGVVTSVSFSRDGRRIVTSSGDRNCIVWEASSGRPLLTLTGSRSEVLTACFSSDEQIIYAVNVDSEIFGWRAAAAAQIREWDREATDAMSSP